MGVCSLGIWTGRILLRLSLFWVVMYTTNSKVQTHNKNITYVLIHTTKAALSNIQEKHKLKRSHKIRTNATTHRRVEAEHSFDGFQAKFAMVGEPYLSVCFLEFWTERSRLRRCVVLQCTVQYRTKQCTPAPNTTAQSQVHDKQFEKQLTHWFCEKRNLQR